MYLISMQKLGNLNVAYFPISTSHSLALSGKTQKHAKCIYLLVLELCQQSN